MSTNKHAIIRYQTLDKCFQNTGRRYYIEDLLEACNTSLYEFDGNSEGIKKRQLYDDVRFMESEQGWSIPLEKIKDGRRRYYRYEDSSFSINNQPLNDEEANQLKEALMTLKRFKGMPQFEWINDITTRLESSFGLIKAGTPVIDFESNPYLKGLEHISNLYRAIIYKKPLKITSESFRTNSIDTYELHPYYLKQYNNRWFLFGYNVELDSIYKKAIDRIDNIQELQVPYIETKINFNEYFNNVIGVTINHEKEPSKVVLRINKELWPYINSKPLHESQSSGGIENLRTLEDGFIDITINVVLNYEIETKILEHGEKVRILEPEALKLTIRDRIIKMAENY
ncbi:helix-turn-helix transcriptional regulator [Winogradskyella sp. Asnod2-B02-A]|uniref:helix-turn-helix transcriptional regulator n=1 Tax=Winogradskyella sp. Asnod2-B02-A TaxID=3160583 RepID=UPI00386667F8